MWRADVSCLWISVRAASALHPYVVQGSPVCTKRIICISGSLTLLEELVGSNVCGFLSFRIF